MTPKVMNIQLDDDEGIRAVTVLMTASEAATIVEQFGKLSPATGGTAETSAIFDCLSTLFNRFYEDGVDDFRRGAKPIS